MKQNNKKQTDDDDVIYIGQKMLPKHRSPIFISKFHFIDDPDFNTVLPSFLYHNNSVKHNNNNIATIQDLNLCQTTVPTTTLIDVCPICLEKMTTFNIITKLPCGHSFHNACITPWLTETSNSCPMCRTKVKSKSKIKK